MHPLNLIDSLFLQKKISLYLSHVVPEILRPIFDQIFQQNVLFNSLYYKHFAYKFSLRLSNQVTPFLLILDLFDRLLFLENLKSNWLQLF